MTATSSRADGSGPGRASTLSPADYMRRAREIRADGGAGLEPLRVAFLGSFTLGFVEPYFVVEAARWGYSAETYFGAFGQFEQEVAGPNLRRFAPDALVIAMRPEDVEPDAVGRYLATGGRRYAALLRELTERLEGLVQAFREWSRAPVLVANFAPPGRLPMGIFDANVEGAMTYEIGSANGALQRRVAGCSGAVIWDYAGLVRARGTEEWSDRRLWALARVPIAPRHQPELARHLARTIRAVRTRPAKCLVVDLDHTLWGGVIGDDGISGIALGDDYPGNVYKSFQRSLLTLVDRGVLLAVASKNERDVVEQVFREHPDMLLRWEHVAAARVGWEPKSRMLREIASELNIGSDALVLFDDNPVERAEVRANAPEVAVVDVPADPLRYEDALWDSGYFDQYALSQEDLRRNELYRSDRERRAFASRFESVEDFLRRLEMVALAGDVGPTTIGRVAQLVNKTNQFNLTSRRRSQAELEALAADGAHRVVWIRVRDRFGDQGIVGVGILRLENDAGVVDTFLMSCRMMNRHVEDALLALLAERARDAGKTRLVGDYVPTPRNRVVADLYTRFGFEDAGELGGGARRFVLDLGGGGARWPEVIRRETPR